MSQISRVVINSSYGGYGLSEEAKARLKELGEEHHEYDIPRHDPTLIQVIEELGSDRASGNYAQLEIVEIVGRTYRIEEYDGMESVVTPNIKEWTVIG
jgi:hypothetical protein